MERDEPGATRPNDLGNLPTKPCTTLGRTRPGPRGRASAQLARANLHPSLAAQHRGSECREPRCL
eukprot:1630542-Alexandrium_andersonii.AAC.1